MLRNIDRKRIYQEEVYRHEVRAQLDRTDQKNNKVGGKIWTFVNSAFSLWFLSSVVVGIFSFSYAKWDKRRELEREQRERAAFVEQENIQRARKLDAEISSRLTYFFYSQYEYVSGTMTTTVVEVRRVREDGTPVEDDSHVEDSSRGAEYEVIPISEDGIRSLNSPSASDYKSGDPEYVNRSLRSLLEELEAVVPPWEKNEISLALNRFIKVQPIFIGAVRRIKELKKDGKPSNVKIDAETFNEFCESAKLKRWGVVIPINIQTETAIREVVVE